MLGRPPLLYKPIARHLSSTTYRVTCPLHCLRTMSTKQQAKILSTEEAKVEGIKWLKMERIKWQDEDGKERIWEAANRTTRKGDIDSVHIFTLLHHPSKPVSTILIEQYRPPIGKYVVELPAGLVDEGEDARTAALRELYEETGYGTGKGDDGKVVVESESVILAKDPGMTGANCKVVTVSVKLDENDPEPDQHLDPGEHIIKRIVPLRDLSRTLQDYDQKGFVIDALTSSIVMGYELAGKLAK
ncbi:NUDIX hydrolase domain-like protein [Kockovaella imperatae]|uniref:NUDIX hydrolase domain-like protein n=1 Tax=Kockovaella imperatae TaxID=4999 RepID=A0A1Y1U9H5_9TREE|nr:NUDIX hydrolase domain-like protein [Kockovaella imperatae]ORX34157.1 NUDIX hydrolase domain-like protein [Kockovaella imperatae]